MFFPLTLGIYFWLNNRQWLKMGLTWLVIVSLAFYGYWNPKYIILIILSIFINYTAGYLIAVSKERNWKLTPRIFLIAGITIDLSVLGYYKYCDFFISNINSISSFNLSLLHLALPLGISFFTFTQIAYLVDTYQGKIKERDILSYFLFVTFFPHLLAGPILHYRDMMPQFIDEHKKSVNLDSFNRGLFLFSIGLFKKVIIADTFASWADPGFSTAYLTMVEAWAASISYTFQIYFDFSGYTDMALGLAQMLNIRLPQNFNSPYKANSIIDFWRRWHITLSNFLKDYLYIPLGGTGKGHFAVTLT